MVAYNGSDVLYVTPASVTPEPVASASVLATGNTVSTTIYNYSYYIFNSRASDSCCTLICHVV